MSKRKSVVLHDESVNTQGFRMLTSGADLSEFKKNPVLLVMHDDYSFPIGRFENIRKEGGKILADPVFDMKDEKGKTAAQKFEDGFLRAFSIGAWPPEETSEDPDLMLPGQKYPTVTKWKVREASICTIGSNHNALVLYDRKGEKIDMSDMSKVIKLFDVKPQNQFKNENKMSQTVLNTLLKLSDSATEQDRLSAIQGIINLNDQLKDTNAQLKQKLEDKEKAEKESQKAQAIVLCDAAVKDGRINATGKDQWIKLFDNDFESTKGILEGLPIRRSVSQQIEDHQDSQNTNLSDMQKASWDELDRGNKLIALKDNHPDIYKQKYKEKFGVEPKI